MLPGYGSNGCPRALAGRYQFSFELGCVGSVGASGRILGEVWVFEHSVHDGLRAHDLARCESSIQDGFAGRLRELHVTARNKLKSAQKRPSIIAACWMQATLW